MAVIPVQYACATTRARGLSAPDTLYFQFDPMYSFDPSKSLSGVQEGNQWKSQFIPILPEYPIKLNADLGSEYDITTIRYVNSHDRGGETIWGINHVRIYGAKNTAEGTTAYNEVRGKIYNGLTLLTNGTIALERHVDLTDNPNADNMHDFKTISLPNHGPYRYYIFEIDDAFFSPPIWMGIRRIEFNT